MRQLTGQDSIYLYLEGGETSAHVAALMMLDQKSAEGGLVTFKQILQHMENCLPDLPVLTQKIVQVPLQLDYPFLGHDPDFDLEYHVRHIALPHPGDWRQLCIQAARIHARGLDMQKPLWEMYVIEGVNNAKGFTKGSFALLFKIHHALIDGGAFAVLLSKLMGSSAEQVQYTPKSEILTRAPAQSEALMMAMKSAVVRPIEFAGLVGKLAPRYLLGKLKSISDEKQLPKPKTLFNEKIGPHRVVEGAQFDFTTFNSIRTLTEGSTVNDVVLAICGGAIRDYLIHHKSLPDSSLIAGAPVNLNPNRTAVSDNDISLLQFPIHSELDDPIERLLAVYQSTTRIKRNKSGIDNRELGDLSKQIPAPILSITSNVLYKSGLIANLGSLFNLIITNVPGPRQPLYFCGAQLSGLWGLAPLAHTVGLVISQFSYNGKMFFGISADRDMVPDPEFLVQCLEDTYECYCALLEKPKNPRKVKRKIVKKKNRSGN